MPIESEPPPDEENGVTPPTREEIVRLLTESELGVDAVAAESIEPELKWRLLHGGEDLCRENEVDQRLFIVVSGRLRVTRDGGSKVLSELGAGAVVGEISLLTNNPRSATVTAVRDTELLELSRSAFEGLIEHTPRVAWALAQVLASRMSTPARRPTEGAGACRIWCLLPNSGLSPDALVESFRSALSSTRTVRFLRRADVEERFGPWPEEGPHPRHLELVRWVNGLERGLSIIVYVADARPSEWSVMCARQCDRIVSVCTAKGDRRLSALETQALDVTSTASRSLVLIHPPSQNHPSDAAAWLAKRPAFSMHHVREGVKKDFERAVRVFTGRATGLVLGGGGARSFAQIGVVRALQESGVEIDVVAGTSMGAIIGAMVADSWDYERVLEANRKIWLHNRPTWELNVPVAAMLGDRGLNRQGREYFGERGVEDLMRHFFCVSTNLTRRQEEVHDRGDIWSTLRASAAIPGVVAPFLDRGELLVDGGVLNNLPTDEMRRRTPLGHVIAVDVYKRHGMRVDPSLKEYPSGMRLLWQRSQPWGSGPKLPSFVDIMEICVTIGSARSAEVNEGLADLVIHPPVEDYGILQFRAIDKLAAIGYEEASRVLEDRR